MQQRVHPLHSCLAQAWPSLKRPAPLPLPRYVLWPRVDLKTCFKSITAAGFEVVPIPMRRREGAGELTTNLGAIQQRLEELGAEQVGWGRHACAALQLLAPGGGWPAGAAWRGERSGLPALSQPPLLSLLPAGPGSAAGRGCSLRSSLPLLCSAPARPRDLQVACVVTTTSCFAPRAADDVVAVAKLCQAAGVAHIINNAYGVQVRGPPAWNCVQSREGGAARARRCHCAARLPNSVEFIRSPRCPPAVQSRQLCAAITSAWRKGRVDCVVQARAPLPPLIARLAS